MICCWCDVDVCRVPRIASTLIIAQHTVWVQTSKCGTMILQVASLGLSCEITGEPLNSHSRNLAPNWHEITGVDCIFICPTKVGRIMVWCMSSICPSVRPSICHTFLAEASFGLWVLSLPESVCLCVCLSVCVCGKHVLVRAITRHPFKLGSPNLDHRCKRPWLRSLLFLGVIDLDLQGQI